MKIVSGHLKDYCQGCGSFFVNNGEDKRRMLTPEESRKFQLELSSDLGLFQKIGVIKRCFLCLK